ncbi:hypothetical protein B0J11DRAFT_586827 [Dendryphion nanum]|uniref:ubiquitinyl hydrolase 1 n=1 Tax=Dendryphion nanum TaxID=256645 RepID=A0A9P9I5P9_9PLEO|nr:hypothetical protein B0J11DRAFT_586827 [Dendryphion nanum]
MPLSTGPINSLTQFSNLSPRRDYYLKDKHSLQVVDWDPSLTVTIQHDAFEGLVHAIWDKSERLRVFTSNNEEDVQIKNYVPNHLRHGGLAGRYVYERRILSIKGGEGVDKVYNSRGRQNDSAEAGIISHLTKLLQAQPFTINTSRNLSEILQDWNIIGGLHTILDEFPPSLADMIDRNIGEQWCSLATLCRRSHSKALYQLMFRLGLMSLNTKTDLNAIKVLAAMTSLKELKLPKPPSSSSFNQFCLFEFPTVDSLFRIISADLPEKPKRRAYKAQVEYFHYFASEGRRLSQHFLDQWPNKAISLGDFESDAIDAMAALEQIMPEWCRLHANLGLSEYATKSWSLTKPPAYTQDWQYVLPSLSADLIGKPLHMSLDLPTPNDGRSDGITTSNVKPSKQTAELRQILENFISTSDSLRKHYGNDLKASLDVLTKINCLPSSNVVYPRYTRIGEDITKLRATLQLHFNSIRSALYANEDRFRWLELGNLWPRNNPTALLEPLRSSSNHAFGSNVKEAIVSYDVLITLLQRLLRIQDAQIHNDKDREKEELRNPGHGNWRPIEYPDWLLLEIDTDSENIVHRAYGDGGSRKRRPTRLSHRAKSVALTNCPNATISAWWVGRDIRHIPFSRRTKTGPEILKLYAEIHEDSLKSRGVILSVPEHILSYELSGLQNLVDGHVNTAEQMIEFQDWLNAKCRDWYSIGRRRASALMASGASPSFPGERSSPQTSTIFNQSIQVIQREDGYPMIHFLRPDVEE